MICPVGSFAGRIRHARSDRDEAIHTCLAESWIASRRLSPLIGPRFPAGLLGRRQVERQWILIPPYGASNPPAPARHSLDLRLWSIFARNPCNLRGIRVCLTNLQGSENWQLWRESPESLQPQPQKFPFQGDFWRRQISIPLGGRVGNGIWPQNSRFISEASQSASTAAAQGSEANISYSHPDLEEYPIRCRRLLLMSAVEAKVDVLITARTSASDPGCVKTCTSRL